MGNLPKLPMHRPDNTVWCLYGQTDTDRVYAVVPLGARASPPANALITLAVIEKRRAGRPLSQEGAIGIDSTILLYYSPARLAQNMSGPHDPTITRCVSMRVLIFTHARIGGRCSLLANT